MKEDKWLVLGDMLELGDNEQQYHEDMAKLISDEISGVCLFGPRMKWLRDKLTVSFSGEVIWSENDYAPIIEFLKERISSDSIILVKGSRGMALEKVIEPFTAN